MADARGIEARKIRIHGLVQGVFFRKSARREAESWDLAGWARNEPDGSVTILVEGDPDAIAGFLPWCEHGPERARVDRVEVEPVAPTGIAGFHTM